MAKLACYKKQPEFEAVTHEADCLLKIMFRSIYAPTVRTIYHFHVHKIHVSKEQSSFSLTNL